MRILASLFVFAVSLVLVARPCHSQDYDVVIAGSDTINSELMPQLIETFAGTIPGRSYKVDPPIPAGLPITILQKGENASG